MRRELLDRLVAIGRDADAAGDDEMCAAVLRVLVDVVPSEDVHPYLCALMARDSEPRRRPRRRSYTGPGR